jgi:energy-coupling factor transport system substrate-specific component
VACAVIIAWGLDLMGLVPFTFLAVAITLNNALTSLVLGPPLLLLLYPRVKKMGLVWTDLMTPDEVGRGFARHLGAILMAVGAIGGLVAGLAAGKLRIAGTCLSVLPFLALMAIASFMLSGREQFAEE